MPEKKLTVLVIEDEQVFRTLALQVFEGCEKIAAANAAEGFAKFKEFCPDIVLLDIGLPDKNGLELLPQIISYDPEAFVVMLTMSRVSTDVKLARERGAAGYIIKPFSHQKVSMCIAKYKEYKKKLQEMTPEERAGNLVEKLKFEALHDDLNQQLEENIGHVENKIPEKTPDVKVSKVNLLLQSWKILFADDFLINRERAQTQLQKLGAHIDITGSGNDILERVKQEHYDVILIDSKMTDMDGYEVAKQIRKIEAEKNIKEKSILIIMVENPDELDRHLWQKAGMNDFIKKPASFTKICDTIRKHAKRQLNSASDEYIN
jgi:CheY-like chemotaxis protein